MVGCQATAGSLFQHELRHKSVVIRSVTARYVDRSRAERVGISKDSSKGWLLREHAPHRLGFDRTIMQPFVFRLLQSLLGIDDVASGQCA